MCLSIPAKVEKIEDEIATVSVGGTQYEASLQMLDDVVVGDYILMHTGFAIQKLDAEEAAESLKTFQEFEEMNKMLDLEEKETGERIV